VRTRRGGGGGEREREIRGDKKKERSETNLLTQIIPILKQDFSGSHLNDVTKVVESWKISGVDDYKVDTCRSEPIGLLKCCLIDIGTVWNRTLCLVWPLFIDAIEAREVKVRRRVC
jgi:hypothetical protein